MVKKGQISIEIIILLGIVILGAVLVSIFLIQNSTKSRNRIVIEEDLNQADVFNEINSSDKTSGTIGLILNNKISKSFVVFKNNRSFIKGLFLK
jgi:uncharacterized protein (UPF0333 family)